MEPLDPNLSQILRLSVSGASFAGAVLAALLAVLILLKKLHVRPRNAKPHALILISIAGSYAILVWSLWGVRAIPADAKSWGFFVSQALFIIGAVWLAYAATTEERL